jgi:polar amino acid transport system substrate-binding protein
MAERPVEQAGSMIAHCVREVLATRSTGRPRVLTIRRRKFEVFAYPLTASGRPCGAVLLLRDMSPARIQDAEAGAEASLEALWNHMSHAISRNFQNAFVPIQTCAELLPTRFQDPTFREFFIETVTENVDRISKWIDQLLSFCRAGGEESWCQVPILEAIDAGVAWARQSHPEIDPRIESTVDFDTVVAGSRGALERVFMEVVGNAMEAAQDRDKPVVSLVVSEHDGWICITLQDNGPGIEESIRNSLFDPFATGKLSGSLGLGLAYVRRAVSAHGGTVEAESVPGQGAAFRIRLPRVDPGEELLNQAN